jgi:signal transduction histidine kinase
VQTTPEPPPLRPWSRIWRYLLAATGAAAIWLLIALDLLSLAEADGGSFGALAPPVADRVVAVLVLDLVLGVVALALLPLRRRHPAAIACTTAALTSVSGSAAGAAALAAVSMSTWRRRRAVLATGATWAVATVAYEWFYRPSLPVPAPFTALAVVSALLALVVYAACVATGFYVGARRELLASLRDQVATVQREQLLMAEAARVAERTRIAREMHDVLAHRISLVAMHAGVLGYRSDLSPEESTQAAAVIQENAHRALSELRQVLGVLRAGDGAGAGGAGSCARPPDPAAEPPQPTLAELPALLADATAAGDDVTLVDGRPPGAPPSATASRTAFRIVQECLTNARKHAPSVPVRVETGCGSGSPARGPSGRSPGRRPAAWG